MLTSFDQLTIYIKSLFLNSKNADKFLEKEIITKTDDFCDDVSICSVSIDLPEENYLLNKTRSQKSINYGYIYLFRIPILYFTINLSLIIVQLYLLFNKGYSLKYIDYFTLADANRSIYELFHIVSFLLGLLMILILQNTFKDMLSSDKSIKVKTLSDFLVFFGILINLFDFSNCIISIYSISVSLMKVNYIYMQIIFIGYVTSTIVFSFIIILLTSHLKEIQINHKWLNYKIVTMTYTIIITIVYIFCLAFQYKIINKIPISKENLDYLIFILPYLLNLMSNLLILSNYDLFENSRFSLISDLIYK